VRALRRRAVADVGELAGALAESAGHLEPGLVVLQRTVAAGEVMVDLALADASGRLVLAVCDVVAGAETVLRAVEGAAWWSEHASLRARVFPHVALEHGAAPRVLVAATRFSDRARLLLRALGSSAPEAVECVLFEDANGPVVALDRLDLRTSQTAAGAPLANPPAPPLADPPTPPGEEAGRAAALVQRLERLRFSESFRA
jgi:hypothetical protein